MAVFLRNPIPFLFANISPHLIFITGQLITRVVPIPISVSKMPPILLKMLDRVLVSTRVYAPIQNHVIYVLEMGPCYFQAGIHLYAI